MGQLLMSGRPLNELKEPCKILNKNLMSMSIFFLPLPSLLLCPFNTLTFLTHYSFLFFLFDSVPHFTRF